MISNIYVLAKTKKKRKDELWIFADRWGISLTSFNELANLIILVCGLSMKI